MSLESTIPLPGIFQEANLKKHLHKSARIYVIKMLAAVRHTGKKLKIQMFLVGTWLN